MPNKNVDDPIGIVPKLAFCVKGIGFECLTVQIFTDVIELQSKVTKIKELKKIV